MDKDDRHFELLLSEKQFADSLIGGYAELNLKVIGLFGAGVVLLGWLYSEKGPASLTANDMPMPAAIVCLLLALVGCGVINQGVSTYSLSLGYIQYKNEVLNPAFQQLLGLDSQPLKAVATWSDGAAKASIGLASILLSILHKAFTITLLVLATYSLPCRWWFVAGLSFAWCYLVLTFAAEVTLFLGMKRVLLQAKATSR